jgi:hypothetical protein
MTTPYSLSLNYSELHVVEYKQIDAVNYSLDIQY